MNSKRPPECSADTPISDRSAEQMRTIIDGYAQFVRFGVPGKFVTDADLNNKVLCYAEENVANAFAYARKLLQVKDPQELFALQAEFVQAQLQAMAEQIQDLGKSTTRTLMDSADGQTEKDPSA